MTRLSVQAELQRIRLELSSTPDVATVFVDPVFFGRALDNLIANSLQFAPAASKIRIECTKRQGRGVIVLMDDGPVVPIEMREMVLTGPGQSVAKHHFEARYGRGLGLYCAAEAARLAGAEVTVGRHGQQVAFELSAPLAPSSSDPDDAP